MNIIARTTPNFNSSHNPTIQYLRENYPDQFVGIKTFFNRKKGRWEKRPIVPGGTDYAKSNDPSTWGRYEDALESSPSGHVGFVLNEKTKSDGICVIDVDRPLDDPFTQEMMNSVNSYWERSISGTGAHCCAFGELPDYGRMSSKHQFEIYNDKKIITLTGNHIQGTPLVIRYCGEAILIVHKRFWPIKPLNLGRGLIIGSSDDEIDKILSKTVFKGSWSGNPSERDAQLAMSYARFARSEEHLVRLMLEYPQNLKREKWDRSDYLPRTAAFALKHVNLSQINADANQLAAFVEANKYDLIDLRGGENLYRTLMLHIQTVQKTGKSEYVLYRTQIMKCIGTNRTQTVTLINQRLENMGFIEVVGQNDIRANLYRLNFEIMGTTVKDWLSREKDKKREQEERKREIENIPMPKIRMKRREPDF